jgi:hypothetical protein
MNLADINFYKFLAEMSGTRREVFHFTSTYGLAGILKDGYIKPSDFDVSLQTAKDVVAQSKYPDKGGHPELAVVRPSMAHKKNIETLSENIGLVKLIIKTHILTDKVRGTKIKPIAEFPIAAVMNLQDIFIEQGYVDEVAKVYAKKTIRKMAELKDKNGTTKELKDWLEKSFKWKEEIPIKEIEDESGNAVHYTRHREGEERIELRKTDRIPLDSVYLKIELQKGFTQDFEEGYIRKTDFAGQEVLEVAQWNRWLKKWNALFVDNDEFMHFKVQLAKMAREYGHNVALVKPVPKKVVVKPLNQAAKEALIKSQNQGVRFHKGEPKIEKPTVIPKYKDLA